MVRIRVTNLGKTYGGGVAALRGLTLDVSSGDVLAVLGPSGSGKSTFLRLLAGLETPTEGAIDWDGTDARGMPPYARHAAFLFQNPALYPYLSVRANLAFGLTARGIRGAEALRRVHETAERFGLTDLLDRRPETLSGGQRQRVALGRALVCGARVLLLDEPLASLDPHWRSTLRADLRTLREERRMTMILVTHDPAEALALADHTAVFHQGRLVHWGPRMSVVNAPQSAFAARYGSEPPWNLFPVRHDAALRLIRFGDDNETDDETAMTPPIDDDIASRLPLPRRRTGPMLMAVRPEDLQIQRWDEPANTSSSDALWRLAATVTDREDRGRETWIWLRPDRRDAGIHMQNTPGVCVSLTSPLSNDAEITIGARVRVVIPFRCACWLEDEPDLCE